jgi:pimeloyl-ACP methyl ester carboxylesterase
MAPVRVATKTPTRFGLHHVVLIGDRGMIRRLLPPTRPRTAGTLGGESTGPIPVSDPWDAFADDQLGLMDHLGIRRFFFFGNCIGG